MTIYRSSEHVERLFCSICGSQLTYKNLERNKKLSEEGKEETVDVSLGTLDEDVLRGNRDIVPYRFAWFEDTLPWMRRLLRSDSDDADFKFA